MGTGRAKSYYRLGGSGLGLGGCHKSEGVLSYALEGVLNRWELHGLGTPYFYFSVPYYYSLFNLSVATFLSSFFTNDDQASL